MHSSVPMRQVTSSHINAIGHDKTTNELHVEYKNGSKVKFKDVDADKARIIMNSGSIGKALHQHVRGQHEHENF